jgi:hypothetical protein
LRRSLFLCRQLALLPGELLLAVGESGLLLRHLGASLLAVAVRALELAQAGLGGLLPLRRERLLGGELGLQVGHAGVLRFDRPSLVADAPFPLLQLDLEFRQLRRALVQGRGPLGQLLLRAHVLIVGVRALVERVAQRGLACLRRQELRPERLELRADDGLERVACRPRGQLEAQLDVRLRCLLLGLVVLPPALQLGAQAGPEPLFGLCCLVLGHVGHRRLRSG